MKKFLLRKFGEEAGSEIFLLTEQKYKKLSRRISRKSKNQRSIICNFLLPRIALYKVLLEIDTVSDEALNIVEEYMHTVVAPRLHKKYMRLNRLPFFYYVFRTIFCNSISKNDLWDADINRDNKDYFTITIRKCLWNETFKDFGCPELCKCHCLCDDVTYSNLTRIKYSRTKTLGTGDNLCDFRFEKVKR